MNRVARAGEQSGLSGGKGMTGVIADTMRALRMLSPALQSRMERFIDLSKQGLPRMYVEGTFVHTVRAVDSPSGRKMRPEGDNLRYTAKCALGLACVDLETQ